ncbi:mRNA 3'-end-processing protein yth1 [Fusarium oxysporum f. sp. phaseoli]
MMLCAVCMSMFQTNVKQGHHHKDYKSVATAAKNGCRICYYISRKLSSEDLKPLEYEVRWDNAWELHWEIEFYETGSKTSIDDGKSPIYSDWRVFVDVSSSSKPPTGYEGFLDFVAADRGSEPTRVRTEFPSLRDIPDNTGHQDVARLAKRWLQTCKDRHDCGSASEDDWHPKRLIHVGNEKQSPRLIISENERPEGCYAALSHCWGEDPKFFMLTSDNLFDLCSEIQLQSLPASFRDAIITCRRIGIPYIWIDSLCILQSGLGSHEDWLSHSEDMHLVYHNCDLNISIDVSENPHGGAFRSRNPTYLQDCYVWTPFYAPPKGLSKSEHDIGDGTEKSNLWSICAIFTADDFSWAREDLPLSDRAWVFQERLLSPRTLHFGSDRISWECDRSHNLTEYLPEGVSDDRWNGFDCLAQNAFCVREKGDLFTYYYDLVFPYTNRQLSHPNEDKLVAFAAVARRCISWFGSDYCAGIFRSTMPQGLLWEMSALVQLGRSKVYRAPSWSWASLDCRVRFGILDGEGTVLVDVVDVAVELVDPNNQFGQVKSASLILTGPLVASDELILKDANDEEFLAEGHTFGISADTVHLWEKAERKAWLISQKNMYLLAVLETSKKPHTYGLLLQKNDDGTFTRAGNWEAGPEFVSKHADATSQGTLVQRKREAGCDGCDVLPGKRLASDDHAGLLVNNGLTYTGEECSAYETFADQPTNQPVAANIPNPVIQWINATNRVRKKKIMSSPRTESRGGSPRHGIARQNISASGSPVGNPIVAQEENEGDVSDSAFGDESSTASISSSILEYRKFQGRTFHSERYNTEYFTPNDEQQRDSIDITHHVLTLLLDGKPTLVPLNDNIQLKRVLDVGTGTGIDFADEHPNAEVIGTDLSPIQPGWVPPNVKFELEDATKDWSWPENHFDLVHVRFLIGAIADWGTLFKEASHCCKPGGFVESGEINPTFYSDDGTIDDVEALQTWNRLVIESGKGFGRSFTDIENDVQLFREAGLVDVKSFDFKVPIGGWPKDEKMRKVGQFLRASIENDLEGYTMMVWHHIMNWPKDEYQDKRIHGYMRVRYVYGRKPDVEE